MIRQREITPEQLIWASIALASGGLVAWLPPLVSIALVGGVALVLISYYEPLLALLVMLAVAPLRTLIETETAFALPVDVGQLALAFFVGVWALRQLVERYALRVPWLLLGAIFLFLLTVSPGFWVAFSSTATFTEWLKWVQVALLVVIIANLANIQWAVFAVIFAAGLQAVLGLWQFAGGSGAAHLWILDFRFFRAFGTFGQPNPFGAFMGMVLPLAGGAAAGYVLAAWQHPERAPQARLWAALYSAAAMIILGGLLVSWSRGAWLGFLVAATVVVWSLPRRRWVGTSLVIFGLGAGLLLWAVGALPASLEARLTGFLDDFTGIGDVRGVVINDDNFAVIERLAHWQAAQGMAQDYPWFGVGFGNYEVAYAEYALINWPNPLGHAHNYYLNLLAETGIIGLLGYSVMWSVIIGMTLFLLSNPSCALDWHYRGIVAGLLGSWTHITVHSMLDKLYVNNLFLHLGVMLGILALLFSRDIKRGLRGDPAIQSNEYR
ncbi:MAG: O-antigen ligase family protein [Anaerolineales bacterium]